MSLSNVSAIDDKVVTHLAALVLDCSVKLEPIVPIISLNRWLICSLYRSHGMLLPRLHVCSQNDPT